MADLGGEEPMDMGIRPSIGEVSTQEIDSSGHSPVNPVAVGEKLPEKISDKLVKAEQLKEEGNEFFKERSWKKAIKKYHHGLMYVKGILDRFDAIPGLYESRRVPPTTEEKAAANVILASLSNNLAACLMKTEEWERVITYTNKVLELEPQNAKAYFRRGVAELNLNKLDDADSDLRQAETLSPEDEGIKKQLRLVQSKLKQYEKKERKMYSAMFN